MYVKFVVFWSLNWAISEVIIHYCTYFDFWMNWLNPHWTFTYMRNSVWWMNNGFYENIIRMKRRHWSHRVTNGMPSIELNTNVYRASTMHAHIYMNKMKKKHWEMASISLFFTLQISIDWIGMRWKYTRDKGTSGKFFKKKSEKNKEKKKPSRPELSSYNLPIQHSC